MVREFKLDGKLVVGGPQPQQPTPCAANANVKTWSERPERFAVMAKKFCKIIRIPSDILATIELNCKGIWRGCA